MTVTAERKPRKAPSHSPLSPVEFVRAWTKAESMADFCEQTGYSRSGAQSRSKSYRDKGVKLKVFPRANSGIKKLDVNELNAAIEEVS